MVAQNVDDAADYVAVNEQLKYLLAGSGEEGARLLGGEGVQVVWACIDGILHLGQVEFMPAEEDGEAVLGRGGGEAAAIDPGEGMSSWEAFEAAAAVWGLDTDELSDALLTFTRSAGSEERTELNTCEQVGKAPLPDQTARLSPFYR